MAMMPGQGTGNPEQDKMLMEYFIRMGAMQPEQEEIMRKRKTVEALRGMSQLPTDARNAGRLKVASHPLEMLGAMAGQGAAAYQEHGANQQSDALRTRRNQAMAEMAARMGFNPMAGGAPQGVPMQGMPDQANAAAAMGGPPGQMPPQMAGGGGANMQVPGPGAARGAWSFKGWPRDPMEQPPQV